ncbi:hypothetical protein ABF894_004792 [Salmonella enterica]
MKSECYYLNEYKNVEDLKRDILNYNQLRIKENPGGLARYNFD